MAIWNVFSSSDEDDEEDDKKDGCSGHHYGDWEPYSDIDLREKRWYVQKNDRGEIVTTYKYNPHPPGMAWTKRGVLVFQKEKRVCQHDGCRQAETRKRAVGMFEGEDMDSVRDKIVDMADDLPDCYQ